MITVYVLITILALALVLLGSSVRVVTQFERGVVFRFGRVRAQTRGPGLAMIAPVPTGCRRSTCRSSPSRCPHRTGSPATT